VTSIAARDAAVGPSRPRVVALTAFAMVAFAGNSLLCRVALKSTRIDPASFTTVRLASGAIVLWAIVRMRPTGRPSAGSWTSALALFAYAAGFSFAYVSLPASTGALLLFGAVQATMLGVGFRRGERLGARPAIGLALAIGGLIGLLLPGLSAPPWFGALLMLGAGAAWGMYSIRGRKIGDPTSTTAENFARTVPFALGLSASALPWLAVDGRGVAAAVASGALASGVGYAVWYAALKDLRATEAATVQLSVPVLAAIGGILLLGEPVTARLVGASAAILGGIALVIVGKSSTT